MRNPESVPRLRIAKKTEKKAPWPHLPSEARINWSRRSGLSDGRGGVESDDATRRKGHILTLTFYAFLPTE